MITAHCVSQIEHPKITELRSRSQHLIHQQISVAEQRMEVARLKPRETEVAVGQVKLRLEAIGVQKRKAIDRFFALARKATSHARAPAECYGGDVSLSFSSNK